MLYHTQFGVCYPSVLCAISTEKVHKIGTSTWKVLIYYIIILSLPFPFRPYSFLPPSSCLPLLYPFLSLPAVQSQCRSLSQNSEQLYREYLQTPRLSTSTRGCKRDSETAYLFHSEYMYCISRAVVFIANDCQGEGLIYCYCPSYDLAFMYTLLWC